MVVYTANFGDYDTVRSTSFRDVEHILFTDRRVRVDGWKTVVVDRQFENPAKDNRFYKLQPHIHFPGQQTLYMDASMKLKSHPRVILSTFQANAINKVSLYAIKHPLGHTLPMEIDWVRKKQLVDNELLNMLSKRYEHVPRYQVGIEARLMIHTGGAEAFFDTWWNEVKQYAHRDQISFHYARHKTNPFIYAIHMPLIKKHFIIFPHEKKRPKC